MLLIRTVALPCALLMCLLASSEAAEGVNLRWNKCFGDGGDQARSFACNTNSGTNKLVGSFELGSDASNVVGIQALVDITFQSTVVPDWWKFQTAGSCRASSMSPNFADLADVICTDWANGQASGGFSYGNLGSNTARVVISGVVSAANSMYLTAGQEFFAFNLTINNSKTTDAGACGGCETPACITLRSLTVLRASGPNIVLTGPTIGVNSDYATWQSPSFTSYRDADGDGYGGLTVSEMCKGVATSTDCDDSNPAVYPGAVELCNGIDDNCDGRVDELAQAPGLIGWWPGNGNANDATGSNHGTPRNGATFVGGRVGQCFSLDGVNDYIDDLGTAGSLSFVQNTGIFTIEAWIGLDDPNAPREQTLAANIFSSADKGFYFGVVNSGGQHGLQMALGRGGTLIIDSRSPNGLITTPTWHHVATVGDGSHVTFYVDGTAYAGSGTMTALSSGDATRPVDLGWDNFGSYFGGQLDEFAIYNRALSASEIQAIYNAGTGGRCALVGVDDPRPAARSFEFPAPWPNPATRGANILFNLPSAADVRVDVFDIVGRRVLSLINGQYLTPGEHRLAWDGRDTTGRPVTPGIYEVRIATGAMVGVRRIVMIE